MIADLQILADALGPKIGRMMRLALSGGEKPIGGGVAEAMKYFGDNLTVVLKLIAPAIEAIDDMLPGFRLWLDATGYGDDRFMLKTLQEIVNALERMPKLLSKPRLKPAQFARPSF